MLDAERFLSEIEPFNQLSKGEVQRVAHNLMVEYHRKGEVVFKEGSKPLDFLYILRSGSVVLESGGEVVEYLHEGESFGYVSLMSSNPPTATARAVEDSVLFLINKKLFNQLMGSSQTFRDYFTGKLARRLQGTSERKVPSSVEKHREVSIEELNLRPLFILEGHLSVEEAVKEMVSKDSTFVLVKLGKELGILTERDVLKKVLAKGLKPEEVRLEEVATSPVLSLESSKTLYDAMVLMARHGIRKLLIKKEGVPLGVLEDRDLIAYESKNAVLLIKEIDKAKTVPELRYLYNLVREHVLELVFHGTDPERLGEYISELNDRFMKRTVYITMSKLGEEPLVPFSIMVLGSEGRREQSLKTDQDNALIYEDYPLLDFEPKGYFERFSKVYIQTLLEIGFPPCPGKVMVSNPFWRRSSKEWYQAVEDWVERPKPENILNVAIFFDFRNVFGDQTLVQKLWEYVLQEIKNNQGFLPFLAVDAVRFKPPVGFFRNFVVEKTGEHRGEIDIKKGGIFPITQGIRALALEKGISRQNTFERIEELKKLGLLSEDYAKDLKESYRFLLSLRFRFQAQKMKEGKEPDNYVNPHRLSRAEKNTLKDVFRIIKEFQDFLYERYSLRFFE
ncbi:MAG: putative nucleotidyltransferase substrate binding domain-containing protein [Aquificaceae bacterium]|nr:putative nucleotidyltransferase substrate binding domain-containing protein [Aquificaceae bacterium]MDW8295157.1 putative nucleotidyltransferase substrate binding domain-containing protein [Aquificaceae bacterium]